MTMILLAPIPSGHLDAAFQTCQQHGRVAFGTGAWETFAKIDELKNTGQIEALDVLIYPSLPGAEEAKASHIRQDPSGNTLVTWTARFVRWVKAKKPGNHPEGDHLRPWTTVTAHQHHPSQEAWHWFWEVENLCELKKDEYIPIKNLRARGQSRRLPRTFAPFGPMLVERVE